MGGLYFITKIGEKPMKNLMCVLGQDPVSSKYELMSSSRNYKPDPEDHFYDLPKSTRFKNNPQELHIRKRGLRIKNLFQD
jgi:hypothetical protein